MPVKDRSLWLNTSVWCQTERFPTNSYKRVGAANLLSRTRTGVSNPRWKQQIKDLQNAATALTGTFDTYESEVGSIYVSYRDHTTPQDKTVYHTLYGGDFCSQMHSPVQNSWWNPTLSNTKAYNRALTDYLKKVRAVQVAFSAPTFLGELGQTVHMIRHPLQGLRNQIDDYLKSVKQAKKNHPKNWKKNLSGLWLEGAFGWKPLIADIQGAYKAYKGLANSNKVELVHAFGQEGRDLPSQSFPRTGTFLSPYSIAYISGSVVATELQQVRFKGCVHRQVAAPLVEGLESFGFEPSEFFPTVWELLPWSFLIDYFSNIGDIITASCAVTSRIAWTNVSSVGLRSFATACSLDLPITKTVLPQLVSSRGNGTSSKHVRRLVTRTPSPVVGLPNLELEVPGLPAQWANMTALFAQVSNGLHPQRLGRRF